jgi:hypothetical protein
MATTTSTPELTITRTATHEDAQLLVQLLGTPMAQRATDGLELLHDYRNPPTYEQFAADHPRGSEGARCVHALLNLNEMIGTFVKNDLLDRDLVYDLLWVAGAWDRCRSIALHFREESGNAEIYANFERLAAGQPD